MEKQLPKYDNTIGGIDDICRELYLTDYPFFAYIMGNINRMWDTEVNTACVSLKGEMKVNPHFWGTLTRDNKLFVICHEMLHLAMLHIPRFMEVHQRAMAKGDLYNSTIANIAMDCAINQLITVGAPLTVTQSMIDEKDSQYKQENLGDHVGITLEYVSELVGSTLEEKQSAEYYYKAMMDKKDEIKDELESLMNDDQQPQGGDQQNQGQGQGQDQQSQEQGQGGGYSMKDLLDAHSKMFEDSAEVDENGNPTQNIDELKATAIRELLENAQRRQENTMRERGKACGGELMSLLPSYTKHDKSIWKRLISRLCGDTPTADRNYQYGKLNRRNRDALYGKTVVTKTNRVWVILDTSGSISNEEVAKFVGKIGKAIRSEEIICDIIQCDADIQDIKFNCKGISKKKGFSVAGRGGTDLTKAQDYIVKHSKGKKTRCVVLTDGYTPWNDTPSVDYTVIYTNQHTKLPNCDNSHSAVLDL